MSRIVRIIAALLFVAGAAYALERWTLRPLRCASAASAGAAGLDRGEPARAIAATLNDCDCMSSSRSRVLAVRAAAFRRAGDHRAAIATYQDILSTDRRPEVYFNLGITQLAAHQRAAALDNLERACAFDPARLRQIPYEELREEVERRLIAKYGRGWVGKG